MTGPAATPARQRAMRWFYSTVLRLATPLYMLRLLWRSRAEPPYGQKLGERLGLYRAVADERSGAGEASTGAASSATNRSRPGVTNPTSSSPASSATNGPTTGAMSAAAAGARPAPGPLWLHAVSLGETRAAAALVDALRRSRPGLRLLLTHGTATGLEAGRALLNPGDHQAWLPYDTPGACARFIAHFRPVAGVLMETEIWPNLLQSAAAAGVPMVLANARLSDKSQRQGERFASLLQPAVQQLALVLAQSDADAQRLRAAGAREVKVSGNLKFDVAPGVDLLARGRVWRAALDRPVLLAAVTREGEEAALLAAWQRQAAARAAPMPLLVIVPRHPQRFDAVAALIEGAGLRLARRSQWVDAPPPSALAADAWLGDSLGEMPLFYALAQVALLGGSFEPLGGQNLIEAAACGCPLVMGPHTFNFADAARLSLASGAALRVPDIDAGLREALALLGGDRQYLMAARAMGFAAQHRGAARRMAEQVLRLLPGR